MKINPVYSATAFGQKDNKKQTLMLPTAVVGAIGGAAYAHQSKIKLDNNNYENSIKIIDEKLDKSPDLERRFSTLKDKITKLKEYNKAQLAKLGVTEETKEISIDDLLKNYVGNESKDLDGLKTDIEFITNRKKYLLSLSKRTAEENAELPIKEIEINERTFLKNLIEKSTDGKINAEEIRKYFTKQITENNFIKDELHNFANIVHSFNKKRLALFSTIGLILGGTIGHMIKTNKN